MSASTRRFARHYVEMVVAMFAGMGVLLPPLGMATRALALLWTDLLADVGTLLVIEHAVMLPAMLVAMLLRRGEYTHHHGAAVVA